MDLPSRAAGFKYIQQRAAKKINRYLSPLQPDYNGDICNEYHHPELSDANLSNELLHTHKYSRHTIAGLRQNQDREGFWPRNSTADNGPSAAGRSTLRRSF